MEERGKISRKLLAGLVAIGVAMAACTGDGGEQSSADGGTEVTVVGTWGGSEQESFLAMVKPWEERTGNTVKYTGSRGLGTYLQTAVASGTLPDLAGLPGPGEMREFYAQGALKPLDDVLDVEQYTNETAPAFVDLGKADDGKIIGVFIKSALKGLIWYNPTVYTGGEPADWQAVMNTEPDPAEALWCVGLESGADSGWPGTDWVEDFVLRQSGPDVYDAWVAGEQAWTSPEIRQAFEAFGEVLDQAYGGSTFVNSTNFGSAGNPLFTEPPGCLFHHQASFITDFFVEQGGAEEGEFDFFPMPAINPEYSGAFTGAGDLFGLFTDKPAAQDLLKYLVTPEAQQIWVSRGGALSGNTEVSDYPDEVSQRSAEILANAEIFRFDAGDLMPQAMKAAFFRAIVDFAENQDNLDQILASLDEVQASSYEQ